MVYQHGNIYLIIYELFYKYINIYDKIKNRGVLPIASNGATNPTTASTTTKSTTTVATTSRPANVYKI